MIWKQNVTNFSGCSGLLHLSSITTNVLTNSDFHGKNGSTILGSKHVRTFFFTDGL